MIAEARVALSKVSLNEVLVNGASLERYRAELTQLAQMDHAKADQFAADVVASVEKMYGFSTPQERDKPFVFQDGVAIIPVHGVLLNRFNSCWGFVTGYNFIRAQMNAADADDDVDLIVFDTDSPGGDKAGCFELTQDIRNLTTKTLAVVDDTACSGGYAIPAACDRVVATPSSQIGSIGVYRLHLSMQGAMEQAGLKFTYVFSGDHKVDGNPYQDLPPDVQAEWQKRVDQSREDFVADVALGRDMDPEAVRATQAQVYPADEALALGLVDAVQTATQAVSAFLAETGDDEPLDDEDDQMALPKTDAELEQMIAAARAEGVSSVSTDNAAKEAVAADRKRRADIMALPEAEKRQKLAGNLADTTDLAVEAVKGILSAAAEEQASAAPKGEGKSHFENAMDKAGGAGVGTDDNVAQPGGEDKPKVSDNIMAFIPKDRRVEAK